MRATRCVNEPGLAIYTQRRRLSGIDESYLRIEIVDEKKKRKKRKEKKKEEGRRKRTEAVARSRKVVCRYLVVRFPRFLQERYVRRRASEYNVEDEYQSGSSNAVFIERATEDVNRLQRNSYHADRTRVAPRVNRPSHRAT